MYRFDKRSCATYSKTCLTDASGSANVIHAEFFSLIEHQQHQRLEQRDLQLLLALQDKVVYNDSSSSMTRSVVRTQRALTSLNSAFSTA